jgi:hypothetical protein
MHLCFISKLVHLLSSTVRTVLSMQTGDSRIDVLLLFLCMMAILGMCVNQYAIPVEVVTLLTVLNNQTLAGTMLLLHAKGFIV